jgi:hypothetical protein
LSALALLAILNQVVSINMLNTALTLKFAGQVLAHAQAALEKNIRERKLS